ncbi:N-acetylmuramoyl-L-alanine amidase [Desulfuromonas sp. TF]|uniref:N-acetylmuramoyl-L-alanine amidase n=1 Tax=Desulfuromonas sp. TF TaxID=1232410 RepID=UPI00041DA587|nr:N-acetylmuramoyl-L-alanine amidase [Desulfuromonas sp. TF]
MFFFRLPILFLIFLLAASAGTAAADAESAYRKAKEGYQQLLKSSKQQLYRSNWEKVIDGFMRVRDTYPRHPKAAAALYMAGKSCQGLYKISRVKKDAGRAFELYSLLAEDYPETSLADDALSLAAGIQEEVFGDFSQAYACYRKVCEQHPSGDMVSAARKKMIELARYAPSRPPSQAADLKASASDSTVMGIRYWSKSDYTRIVIDLGGRADFTSNVLAPDSRGSVPPRIYVDVPGVTLGPEMVETIEVGDGLLQKIRTGRPDDKTVRVVLDLVSFQDYKVFPLEDPYRIVIDVAGAGAPELTSNPAELRSLPPGAKDGIAGILDQVPGDSPLKVRIPPGRAGKGLRRIVVDAGHGGKDPGAIGPKGVMEKDVTLAMAKALARSLEKELGCEVILTRDSDVYLDLPERTGIANRVGADLFISIHANANRSRDAYGVETFYLNFSKNDKAADVVARENGTTLKEVGDLELILFDLMANSKINESSRLAAEIQKSLVEDLSRHYSHIKDMGVRQGPFYVLLGATMPSVLVETAFISNNREEARLADRKFQQKTVEAITRGVRSYAVAHNLIATK